MRVFITGEKGFIGKNLAARMKNYDNMSFVSGDPKLSQKVKAVFGDLVYHAEGEICVHSNEMEDWKHFFWSNKIDVVIHNAATVGTDVVALNSEKSTLTNVQGTYNICRAARHLGIPVCYMGTTVIYDTLKYQDCNILENSETKPKTLYGCQKLCAETIVKSQAPDWMIVRPLFAYGGVGDMNSLIAKSIYSALNGKHGTDMFLDQDKIKDYMHVNDFCDAVLTAIDKGLWGDDWNISAETPYKTGEIMEMIWQITGLESEGVLEWHPATDYLGNHRLSSEKFRKASGWSPKISLQEGIEMSFSSITDAKEYDPLIHLEEAKTNNIDLTKFY